MAKKDWEKKTERNLIYVAITRAKKTLNYIDEEQTKWLKSNGAFDTGKMKNNIETIKHKIDFNSEYGIKENNINLYNIGLKKATKLGEKVDTAQQDKSKKKKAGGRLMELLK